MTDRRVVDHARQLAASGVPIVRIPPVNGQPTKGPRGVGWQTKSASPDEFTEQDNLGIILGELSGLLDVDLDCPEAVALAPRFLPATDLVHGRPSNPSSHYWYRCAGATKQLHDPTRTKDATIVELRGTGGQTMVPPSVHPDGELVRWERAGQPTPVAYDDLLRAVRQLAAAALLARHWSGSRHFASMALCGALARAGWTEDAITAFVTAIASRVNGDDGEPGKRAGHARDSIAKVATGGMVTGLPKLIELGVPDKVIGKVREWLELKDPASAASKTIEAVMSALPGANQPPAEQPAEPDAPAARTRIGVLASEIVRRERPPIRRYESGIPQLDRLIAGGISTRQLAVILAPPADGKSALAVSMARHLQGTVPVLYASTELESEELEARLAAPIIGCSWVEIVDGRAPRDQVTAALAGLRIVIVGCEVLPRGEAALEALDHEIAALTLDYGVPPVALVDYLQDLARGADASNVRGKIGDIASRLRAMAQARDCAIVAVSSVSRAYYGATKAQNMREADDATVYLAAAKESGDVDYAAAVVIFLDVLPRDEGADHRMARIAIAKSRHGTTGIVGARFFGATGRWEPAPDALAVMSIDARTDRRAELRETSDETQLLVAIQKHPDIAWRDLRVLVGLKGERSLQRADHARARLLAGKTIEEVPVEFSDRLHRTQRRMVLRRRDEAAPQPVEQDRPHAHAHPTLTGALLLGGKS